MIPKDDIYVLIDGDIYCSVVVGQLVVEGPVDFEAFFLVLNTMALVASEAPVMNHSSLFCIKAAASCGQYLLSLCSNKCTGGTWRWRILAQCLDYIQYVWGTAGVSPFRIPKGATGGLIS